VTDQDGRDIYRTFEKEKKALVPKRDYVDGHPHEDKIRRVAFKSSLKYTGHDTAEKFNQAMQKSIRTIVSKTYTDIFQTVRYTSNNLFTKTEREEHLDWMFEELEKYQHGAKKLIRQHMIELEELQK